jgi:hypothetical protein
MPEKRICRGFQRRCNREAAEGETLCKKCLGRKKSFKQYGIGTPSTDAAHYRVPGSFESGRKRR